ncbi:dTDP-4-amino-4,6-dideoxygalactose transaminase [Halpernia humi]|uniref:dTDP-4-amino-4,6-dideoxygalactose transaminase n=1 Tax=Halpernia humi TaxID=493375 RepID=A0A1H6A2T1_9FLAO|nr:aminotransferase class I/II-fold pyridoxal phosphate-dependent enzyme [Halpernia humi]SEG42355.1 dTDP-4-amino-4,6-dideoxygalactose transaminase [Halpernia humi]
MSNAKIWLSSPHMGGNELKYIQSAFDENWVAPMGSNVNLFEKKLEEYLEENKYITALSTGTAAVHLALNVLGVKAGDEVICQTMTFSASANPIVYLGAKPIFVDSESDTWNMSPQILEDAIKDRIALGIKPKAIIVVHLYGMPAKIEEILKIANKYEIPLIEDAAESLGSSYKNQKCGTFGVLGVLSFNGNKIITTSGGGALVCTTKEQQSKALFLATQARDSAPHYQHSEIGFNYRLSNISASIGCGQMEVLEERILQRRKNFKFYFDLFNNKPGITMLVEPTSDFYSNHWLSAITIDEKITGFSSEDLCTKFHESNIESRPLWKPMHLQPVFADAPYYGGNIAENLFKKGLCLPSGSNLTDENRNRIKKVIESCFQLEKSK